MEMSSKRWKNFFIRGRGMKRCWIIGEKFFLNLSFNALLILIKEGNLTKFKNQDPKVTEVQENSRN